MKTVLKKEDYWKILNGKLTLIETMKLLGLHNPNTNKDIKNINSLEYAALAAMLMTTAYRELIKLKEIDTTKIFNLGNKKYEGNGDMFGDIGLKEDEKYNYLNNKWIKFNKK